MIPLTLNFALPEPWTNKTFSTRSVGTINFLVGPNGSGKSRFALTMKEQLPGARILSTDRLQGMESAGALRNVFGDNFASGFEKRLFGHFKTMGANFGSGLDTIVLLEERLDLRIQVEATLSHLFNRKITFEWDSGNLVPKAAIGATGASYRLDRDECHGIKELLILLAHLYNEDHKYLIIDEPELNLHPQYQAFFMQEVRRVAGDPKSDHSKKVVFLITHSPFILDFRTVEDVKAVMSFDLQGSVPKQLLELDAAGTARLATLVPRLNVHHKQLFFSDNPVFVEGILDAQLVATVQEARGVSMAGAGSCVIDAGGAEEVNHYLELCTTLGKRAFFLYDLDSLFRGNLKACVRADGTVQSFLASVGVGSDFGNYCGELETKLTYLIDRVIGASSPPPALVRLVAFLQALGPRREWSPDKYPKARVAVLTAVSRERPSIVAVSSERDVAEVEGRLQQLCAALRQKNVLLLPGGTLERYLPSYPGDPYEIADNAKSAAVSAEVRLLAGGMTTEQMAQRYGKLFELISALPSKGPVDVEPVLADYLAEYIHVLQGAILANVAWQLGDLQTFMSVRHKTTTKIFSLTSFSRSAAGKFSGTVVIEPLLGQDRRRVIVTEQTNAGMRTFKLEPMVSAPDPV